MRTKRYDGGEVFELERRAEVVVELFFGYFNQLDLRLDVYGDCDRLLSFGLFAALLLDLVHICLLDLCVMLQLAGTVFRFFLDIFQLCFPYPFSFSFLIPLVNGILWINSSSSCHTACSGSSGSGAGCG